MESNFALILLGSGTMSMILAFFDADNRASLRLEAIIILLAATHSLGWWS